MAYTMPRVAAYPAMTMYRAPAAMHAPAGYPGYGTVDTSSLAARFRYAPTTRAPPQRRGSGSSSSSSSSEGSSQQDSDSGAGEQPPLAPKDSGGGDLPPLHAAARDGDIGGVEESLCTQGAEAVCLLDPGGYTALHWASRGGHLEVVERLLLVGGEDVAMTVARGSAMMLVDPSGASSVQLKGHDEDVNAVAWTHDGFLLASASDDGAVRTWGPSGQARKTLKGDSGRVYSVAWNKDGLLASGGRDEEVRMWEISDHGIEAKGKPTKLSNDICALAWSPDGGLLAVGDADNNVSLFTADRKGAGVLQGHEGKVHSVAWNSDGSILASGSDDCTVRLWKMSPQGAQKKQKPQCILEGHEGCVYGVAFSPDGSLVASGGGDGTVRLWGASGERKGAFKSRHEIYSVAWSPDGSLVATGEEDGKVRLWSPSGDLWCALKGHESRVRHVAWNPQDASALASAAWDNTVRLWGPTGLEQMPFPGGTALHAASAQGHTRVAMALLNASGEALAGVLSTNPKWPALTAAGVAKQCGHTGVADAIEAWAGQRKRDGSRHLSEEDLRAAALRGDARAVRRHLSRGVDPLSRDGAGRTALHVVAGVAAGDVGKDVVGVLIQAGGLELAEARAGGRTAAEVAEFFGNKEVAARIRDEVGVLQKAREVSERVARQAEARCREMRAAYDKGRPAGAFLEAGEYEELVRHMMLAAPAEVTLNGGRQDKSGTECKFGVEPSELVCGEYAQAARGLHDLLQVDEDTVNASLAGGLSAMEREIAALGEKTVVEDFHYVTRKAASEQLFHNGMRDKGRAGMRLGDFVKCREAQEAGLKEAEVAALRLYTLPSFKYINMPMRDLGRLREGRAHPLPVTTSLIVRGLKKLRAVGSSDPGHLSGMTLWRGMKHLRVGDGFAERGGTELAPMSTTVDAGVAVAYSSSECSLLFRLTTRNRLERGAEVGWVSAFPNESETLFPPLTFMQPTGQRQQIEVDGRKLTVVECSVTLAA